MTQPSTLWTSVSISVADYNSVSGPLFENISTSMQQILSSTWNDTLSVHVRQSSPMHLTREEFRNVFNAGAALVSFIGYNEWYQFSQSAYFTTWDVDSLSNGSSLPFCIIESSQRFERQDTLAVAVNLLQAFQKGAIATLAPTGHVFAGVTTNFQRTFFQEQTNDPTRTIGKTLLLVKRMMSMSSNHTARIATLLGDPALVIKNPVIAGVQEPRDELPREFVLYQNYPNPFNPSTTIEYSLPAETHVRLKVFNMLGQEVALLVNEEQRAGLHQVQFDAAELASAVYFYRLQAGDFVATKTLVLLK